MLVNNIMHVMTQHLAFRRCGFVGLDIRSAYRMIVISFSVTSTTVSATLALILCGFTALQDLCRTRAQGYRLYHQSV
jgi:hypothetical protein